MRRGAGLHRTALLPGDPACLRPGRGAGGAGELRGGSGHVRVRERPAVPVCGWALQAAGLSPAGPPALLPPGALSLPASVGADPWRRRNWVCSLAQLQPPSASKPRLSCYLLPVSWIRAVPRPQPGSGLGVGGWCCVSEPIAAPRSELPPPELCWRGRGGCRQWLRWVGAVRCLEIAHGADAESASSSSLQLLEDLCGFGLSCRGRLALSRGSLCPGMGLVSWHGSGDLAAVFLSAGNGAVMKARRVRQSLPGLPLCLTRAGWLPLPAAASSSTQIRGARVGLGGNKAAAAWLGGSGCGWGSLGLHPQGGGRGVGREQPHSPLLSRPCSAAVHPADGAFPLTKVSVSHSARSS